MATIPSSGPISLRDVKAVMNPSELIKARYLTFQYGNAYGSGRCMNLGGVRVYTSAAGDNIINSSMTTSSLDQHSPGFWSGNMVDNNDSTFYHSSCGSEYPWVKIDLGSEEYIYRVELTNRVDCCRSRIAGITLQLRDNTDTVIFTSGLIALPDGTTIYEGSGDNMYGYLHYTFWPNANTTPYGSDVRPYPITPVAPTPVTGPIRMSDYRNFYSKGIPNVTATNFSVSNLRGKTRSMLHGLPVRIFRGRYSFSAGGGGVAGSGYYPGGGGAGGVLVYDSGSLISPSSGSTAGGGANGGGGGNGGSGFGAGGGGGGYWFGVGPLPGGNGANGFIHLSLNTNEFFTQTSTSYTFTSTGTVRILLMGGGGGGGNNSVTNSRGGGGGGGGYLQIYNISVTSGTTATLTVGGGGSGSTSQNGGTTSVVINGVTYSASGGGNGAANQFGGAGSSSGGAGGSSGGQTNGGSGGTAGANTSSQGTTSFNTNTQSTSGGYFADDPNWFNTKTESTTPILVTNFTTISTATNGIIPTDGSWDLYSVEWVGYFYAPTTGSYTFYTESNDASYVWIGSTAQSGYTTANALVNNGGIHAIQERSGTISLTADTLYPIRIQFGDNTSSDGFSLSFSGPGITRTYNFSGYVFFGMGVYSNYPTPSARILRSITKTNEDGIYYITVGATSAPTYCLMNMKWDGGGWMMMMKATRGSTFNYYSNYWTDTNTTLNTNDLTRNNADAKYGVMNTAAIKDVMAFWPDVGQTGGSIPQSETWTWLVNNYYGGGGARTTAITGFSTGSARDVPSYSDPSSFPGFSTAIWSSQSPDRRFVVGGVNHISSSWFQVRWGFLWNENGNFGSPDAFGGIGMSGVWGGGGANNNYSAGDYYGCCGSVGLNRTMRVEVYGR